jgi:ATP-binding cassette subfamily B protein
MMQYTIDRHITFNDAQGLINMSLLIFASLVLQSLMQVWSTVLTNVIGQNVIRDMRLSVYDFLTRLRLRFYDKTPVGTLVTRTVSDIETIADVFSEGFVNISGDLLQVILILGFMFWKDWQLSLVSLSVLPILLYAGYVFKEKIRVSFEQVRNQVARLNTFVQEHIQGMQIVQVFNREEREMNKFIEVNKVHRDANIRSVFYYAVFFPVVEVVSGISVGLIVWYGAMEVMHAELKVGVIILFITYINMFFRPVRQMADRFNTMQMGMVSSQRIFALLDDTENPEPTGKVRVDEVKGDIAFEDVWFGYTAGEYVLKGINIQVERGKTVALVGATGAGKSSVINLLSRFYEIDKGVITVDGRDIRELDIATLRKHISVVLQDVFLFSGNVMDNIRLYNKDISEEKVIRTAQMLGAHDFIERLPQGYGQDVHERGATLSVGQRQLISFVRAMVTDPAILILDEATSSVDNETENVIQSAIRQMMKGRTSIVIAHRLSTVQYADEIIVLDKGQIIERGTHAQLLQTNGYYKKLYELQFATSAA